MQVRSALCIVTLFLPSTELALWVLLWDMQYTGQHSSVISVCHLMWLPTLHCVKHEHGGWRTGQRFWEQLSS